jgi:mannosyl-3-phosphoglycerate synthase
MCAYICLLQKISNRLRQLGSLVGVWAKKESIFRQTAILLTSYNLDKLLKKSKIMRVALHTNAERYGSNLFYSVQKVYELDGGIETDSEFSSPFHVIRQIPLSVLHQIEKEMAIVIPIKDEKLRLLEGVLSGIPNACFPIILSNSQRAPTDRFGMERSLLDNFCHSAKKIYAVFHQRSPELAELFKVGGYPHALDEDGLLKNGKAEGMIAGLLIARLLGKKYIGFIDSDNYFPGAVLEYIRLFAAGFSQAKTDFSMVRVQWHSKPKIVENEMYFARLGRVTNITNQYLNQLLGLQSGFETDIILTGNAGEHAMSMELAMKMGFSAGFSVETNHFIDLLENYGGVIPTPFPKVMAQGTEVFQMQSRNPHFHDFTKGEEHLNEMIEGSLSVIYHSRICPSSLRSQISEELFRRKIKRKNQGPTKLSQYPALEGIDIERVLETIDWEKHGNYTPK